MLLRISQEIVSSWYRSGIIPSNTKDAYVYGVQLLLSTTVNVIIIAVISCISHKPLAWILFLIGFIPLRITAGGFHANTPLRCMVSFCGIYTICVIASLLLQGDMVNIAIFLNCAVTIMAVYAFSPVPASNKPLSESEKKRNRARSFAVLATLLLVIMVAIHLCNASTFALYVSLGEIAASIFLCMSKALSTVSAKRAKH